MVARYTRADGTTLTDTVFDYRFELRKVFQGSGLGAYEVLISDDLLAAPTFATGILEADVFGANFSEFTEFHRLRTLQPGDSVELDYGIFVEGDTERGDARMSTLPSAMSRTTSRASLSLRKRESISTRAGRLARRSLKVL